MISWIMACVTTTSFSINVNGNLHAFFKGARGLRKGDPIYPYLFTLVMEVLTLMIRRKVTECDTFRYNPKCEKLGITYLCFADDILMFSYGNLNSVSILMQALDEFKGVSGLTPSLPKSTSFFSISDEVKGLILQIMPFELAEE